MFHSLLSDLMERGMRLPTVLEGMEISLILDTGEGSMIARRYWLKGIRLFIPVEGNGVKRYFPYMQSWKTHQKSIFGL